MMLRRGWNFHDDIAHKLELIARKHYGDDDTFVPGDKIYGAPSIEGGNFIEVMITLLRDKTDRKNDVAVDAFIDFCAKHFKKEGSSIPREMAQVLFEWFLEMYFKDCPAQAEEFA